MLQFAHFCVCGLWIPKQIWVIIFQWLRYMTADTFVYVSQSMRSRTVGGF